MVQIVVATPGGSVVVHAVRARDALRRVLEAVGMAGDEGQCALWCGWRPLTDESIVDEGVMFCRVGGRLHGGKGGFGAMLRSMGKSQGPGGGTRDFGACRDLEGRRLRHVNDEIALERWHEARAKKEALKASPSGLKHWYLGLPSWAEVPRLRRKTKAEVRAEASRRSWREEEEAVEASGVATKHWIGKITMVDSFKRGFAVLDDDCYVPTSANCAEPDQEDDWNEEPLRIGDEVEVWAAYRPRGRNTWAAYKARRRTKASRGKQRAHREAAVLERVKRKEDRRAPSAPRNESTTPSSRSAAVAEAVALGLEAAKRLRNEPPSLALPVAGAVSLAPSPLAVVSGAASVHGSSARGDSEFCTLQIFTEAVRGRYYYEVRLETDGVMQLGWAAEAFSPREDEGDGVGDDGHSWSFDGCRRFAWHGGDATSYGGEEPWRPGDIVGCALDSIARKIWFSRNGSRLGVAFEDLPETTSFLAALSLEDEEALRVVLDRKHLAHLPEGYEPLLDERDQAPGEKVPETQRQPADEIVEKSSHVVDVQPADEVEEKLPRVVDVRPSNEIAETDTTPAETDTTPAEAAPPDVEPEALDLEAFATTADLEALGLDRLKSALLALGCKCGGTLSERAARLLSTKGKSRKDWDPKILAKPRKKHRA